MPKGAAVAYSVAGGLILYSGIKGATIADTVKGALSGSLGNVKAAPSASPGQQTVNTQVTGPSGQSETEWINSFLSNIGAPQTQANVNSISSWISHETPWPPVAANNPLNTTYSLGQTTDYNSVGVKNYGSQDQGMQATVATLESGQYNDILLLLRSGQGLCGHTLAGLSTWSGGGYSEVC